ncbi:Nodulation-signaling pathway 2 protein [Hibiscus syriacus]|uniref:Nodulation-signaling pathway 2 protein n=1 Tax=Hibiscus syriacus TaxID=106335 RepID=A0A6A2XI27_HIBSY|nr:protein NODULATION SIGNALING PATHWAY 2-like [Hibiscus syriacus]KAE8669450.1 Nodulation-signaling pathway 2 protein [Hibiscus syriacus]
MAMAIDNALEFEVDFSSYSTSTTTTTTTDDDPARAWNDWCSPVVDWGSLSSDRDEFQDLIESMMDDGTGFELAQVENESSDSVSVSVSVSASTDRIIADDETNSGDLKGLRLVHLLMAAAEGLMGATKSRELARVIFVRLKELVSPNDGTNMERLAAYFTEALQGLLEGSGGDYSKCLITNGTHHHRDRHHQSDMIAAFQLLQDMSPYVKFGHFTANQAILEAASHDRRIHIVDYDIMEGIQWASLMQALVCREGPPTPHLRITALSRGSNGCRSFGTIQETGRRLAAFAASIGQPFSFHQYKLDSDETFRPSGVKLVQGEALVINCMLHSPHFSHRAPGSVASFLSGAKTLNPRLVTVVEEEVGHVGNGEFMGRFMDSLHHYSAMFDSLEAGFPTQCRARTLVERLILGPRIAGSLNRIYRTRNEDESGPWWEWLNRVGYKAVNISFGNHCQAKLLVGLFNDGFRVEELANNRLVLGWKSRRLLSASIWTSPPYSDL